MKFEFNKQRVIGVAILVVFLLIAVPFLFAGSKQSASNSKQSGDSQIPLDISSDQTKPQVQLSTPAGDTVTEKDNADGKNIQDEDSSQDMADDKDSESQGITKQNEKNNKNQDIDDNDEEDNDSSVTDNTETMPVTPAAEHVKSNVNTKSAVNSVQLSSTAQTAARRNSQENSSTVNNLKNSIAAKGKSLDTMYASANQVHKKTAPKSETPVVTGETKSTSGEAKNQHKKNKSVKAKPSVSNASPVWFVQAGNFANPQAAKKIETKLHAKGYKNVYARKVTTKKGTFERIFIGPMQSKQKAYALMTKIKEMGCTKVYVLKTEKFVKVKK